MSRLSIVVVVALALSVAGLGGAQSEAAARTTQTTHAVASSVPMPAADTPVRCSCASPSSCPQIGTLSIAGHKSEPIYCNQLNGAENPGVHGRDAWFFQCAELSNRWLSDGLGAPMIMASAASEMCENADRRAYEVTNPSTTKHAPVPGDLLIWDGHAFGHVGIVVSVSSSSIAFANQNYGYSGVQIPLVTAPRVGNFFGSPHGDNVLRAKCIIHPKKLSSAPAAAGPCDAVSSAHDGKYCGASRQTGFAGGDVNTLYTCSSGTTSSVPCKNGCTMEPEGRDDHCS